VGISGALLKIIARKQEDAMSERVDKFCDSLRDRLNAIEARVQSIKANVQGLPGKGEKAMQQLVADARTKLHAQTDRLDKARADLKAWAEKKKTETQATIHDWKAKRETAKLDARAEEAQAFAKAAVTYALASIDHAEEAIFDAVEAWMDTDAKH
jgi:ABC-type transporter Mla subunit MlaD